MYANGSIDKLSSPLRPTLIDNAASFDAANKVLERVFGYDGVALKTPKKAATPFKTCHEQFGGICQSDPLASSTRHLVANLDTELRENDLKHSLPLLLSLGFNDAELPSEVHLIADLFGKAESQIFLKCNAVPGDEGAFSPATVQTASGLLAALDTSHRVFHRLLRLAGRVANRDPAAFDHVCVRVSTIKDHGSAEKFQVVAEETYVDADISTRVSRKTAKVKICFGMVVEPPKKVTPLPTWVALIRVGCAHGPKPTSGKLQPITRTSPTSRGSLQKPVEAFGRF